MYLLIFVTIDVNRSYNSLYNSVSGKNSMLRSTAAGSSLTGGINSSNISNSNQSQYNFYNTPNNRYIGDKYSNNSNNLNNYGNLSMSGVNNSNNSNNIYKNDSRFSQTMGGRFYNI